MVTHNHNAERADVTLTIDLIAKAALAELYGALQVTSELLEVGGRRENAYSKGDTIEVIHPRLGTVDVVVDQWESVGFSAYDEDLAIPIEDFRQQFLAPAIGYVADEIDRAVGSAVESAGGVEGVAFVCVPMGVADGEVSAVWSYRNLSLKAVRYFDELRGVPAVELTVLYGIASAA